MASAQPHVIQSRQDIINFVNSNPVTSKSWKIILVALGAFLSMPTTLPVSELELIN